MPRIIPDLSMLVVPSLPAAADHAWQFRVQGGKAYLSNGTDWIEMGAASLITYPKTSVHTTSGNFTLPTTARPDVTVLAVGGGGGGGQFRTAGTATKFQSGSTVLVEAEGAAVNKPGRGGGFGGASYYFGGTGALLSIAPPGRGHLGYGNGGGATTNYDTGAVNPNSGDGGRGSASTTVTTNGGHGGGVVLRRIALTPGATYAISIGAGGAAGSGGLAGAAGRVEVYYMDTVP